MWRINWCNLLLSGVCGVDFGQMNCPDSDGKLPLLVEMQLSLRFHVLNKHVVVPTNLNVNLYLHCLKINPISYQKITCLLCVKLLYETCLC